MPYTASNVPSYVPKSKAKAWAATWNAAYESKVKSGALKDKAEEYAFAVASAKYGPNSEKVTKFGTPDTGFTHGTFGPFKCGNCKFSDSMDTYHICTNDEVAMDPEVTEDDFGNKVIQSDDCCNEFTPKEDGEITKSTCKCMFCNQVE